MKWPGQSSLARDELGGLYAKLSCQFLNRAVARIFTLLVRLDRRMLELFPPDVYPLSGVAPLTPGQRFGGQGFYPGCAGFVGSRPPDPIGGVMFVAHNYSSVQTFEESDIPRGGDDPTGGTLRPLKDLLSRVPIPLERCWFTNAFMGLRNDPNKPRAVGAFPPEVYKHTPYMDANRQFLRVQVQVMQPRVVVFLGNYALRVSDLIAPAWRNHRSVLVLDE